MSDKRFNEGFSGHLRVVRPVESAPAAEGMEARAREFTPDKTNFKHLDDAVVYAMAAFARAEVVRALEAALATYIKGFEQNWVVQDVIDAIRKQIAELGK